ncbi:MAG: isoaspartyl peptidase/L-asparaginase [Melioribacter sp.]|nr:isoaspartyl peptidase/L-asparaginase [Melioribacter sp.]
MRTLPKSAKIFLFVLILTSINLIAQEKKFGIVIHGGAGRIVKENMSAEREAEYSNKLKEVLETGYKILAEGGSALDAVEAVIKLMEDSPLFNAGKGAVLTEKGVAELDASIMDGKTLSAGAVAGIKHVKSPITLARLVMEKSPHVMMISAGAEEFAKQNGLEMVDNEYFITKERWESYQRALQREEERKKTEKHGTVGAVALDKEGNIAAGTSTGGMMMKKFGRVGDAPIIGAGTYANNKTCGVSATGSGEYFIRIGVAKDISSLIEYKGMSLKNASEEVIKKVGDLGGNGGVICLDKFGNVAMPFNTEGMYRGYYINGEKPVIKMYKDE